MGRQLDIITGLHTRTKRAYLSRMLDDKVQCMKVAKEYGKEYWDGNRRYGYGGYRYDGRWKKVAQKLAEIYNLKPDATILDVGCGKAYLIYELQQLLPEAKIVGFDPSIYALQCSKLEIRDCLLQHKAQYPYPWPDNKFDLCISINALHNLEVFDLKAALAEINRVSIDKFICVESYRGEQELFNLQCWALTCECFYSETAWKWIFKEFDYSGDYEFIFFE